MARSKIPAADGTVPTVLTSPLLQKSEDRYLKVKKFSDFTTEGLLKRCA